jgi:hypothetical protein
MDHDIPITISKAVQESFEKMLEKTNTQMDDCEAKKTPGISKKVEM